MDPILEKQRVDAERYVDHQRLLKEVDILDVEATLAQKRYEAIKKKELMDVQQIRNAREFSSAKYAAEDDEYQVKRSREEKASERASYKKHQAYILDHELRMNKLEQEEVRLARIADMKRQERHNAISDFKLALKGVFLKDRIEELEK